MFTRLAILTALSAVTTAVCSADPLVATAVRAGVRPVLDGSLADVCWGDAPAIAGFVLLGQPAEAKEQTSARVAYDEQALYVGITCRESQMDKLVAAHTRPGVEVAGDDCVEVFLDPNHDRFNFCHFIVNAAGAQFEESGDGVGLAADWNAVWQARASRGAAASGASAATATINQGTLMGRLPYQSNRAPSWPERLPDAERTFPK